MSRIRVRTLVLASAAALVAAALPMTVVSEASASGPWTNLGDTFNPGDTPPSNSSVMALTVSSNGNVFVGGDFTKVGNVDVTHIAQWNGTSWSAVGRGVQHLGPVYALAADGGGNVYVGGGFDLVRQTNGDSIPANRVARWNGTTWSALGTGVGGANPIVHALAVDSSGNVYAGGTFTTAGGVTVNGVARWNGSAWSALGSGVSGTVNALAVDSSGNVYAGGAFTTAGGVTVNRVARWNGSTWSALGTGLNGNVRALAVDAIGNLYAGGFFSTAGGVAANGVAEWNGSTWSALGGGVGGTPNALAVDGTGRVYAGGDWTTAGGSPGNYVARWDGSTWSALGSGLSQRVQDKTLAVRGSTLYAGSLGRVSSYSIANPALTPTFDTPVRTADGFTVNVTNYDAAYSWTPTVGSGSVVAGTATGSTLPLTVTGLAVGTSATVTVQTTRTAYSSGSATVSGQALSTQSVSWSPTTSVLTTSSPLTPSAVASALGGATITYAVTSAGTTGCTVDPTSAQLTFTGAGTCTVRATAGATSAYTSGSTDVTFTVSRATPSLSWSPTLAVDVRDDSAVFAAASTSSDGSVTYAVTSAGTTGCTVNSATRTLSYTGSGSCAVTATVAATASYDQATSVQTFAISRATQTLTWTSVVSTTSLALLSVALGAASTTGDGSVSYSVTSAGGTGCAFDDTSIPVLTYAASGTCSVTATAAQTVDYAQATTSATIAITQAVPVVSWSPSTALTLPGASVTPTPASTTGDGVLTYAVTNAGSTGCSWDSSSGALSYATSGSCVVTASTSATSHYAAGSVSVTFVVSKATPIVSWSPTTALLTPGATVTPSPATTSGDGTLSYAVISAGSSGCTWDDTAGTLTYLAAGSCTVRATASSTSTYHSASAEVTFMITHPAPAPPAPPAPPPPSPSPSPSTSPSLSPSPTPSPSPSPSPSPTPSPSPSPTPSPSPPVSYVESMDGVPIPHRLTPGLGLPPSPTRVQVLGPAPKVVRITLPPRTAGSQILSTVVSVVDHGGAVVARIVVPARPGQQVYVVDLPVFAAGYSVRAYTVNPVGISRGGFSTSPLVHASTLGTVSQRSKPLLGTRVGSPVFFAGGSAVLDAQDRRQLVQIAKSVKASTGHVYVTGFARKGSNGDSVLARLSTQRARAVSDFLADKGVRVWIRFWGAGSMGGTGTAVDRRVEVRSLHPGPSRILEHPSSRPSPPGDLGP